MNLALRSLDYEGTLVHLMDNRLETLHLVHRVRDGQAQERLVSLSGPVRAVTRQPERVTCVLSDGHPVSVRSHASGRLLKPLPMDPAALGGLYRVSVEEGAARVAGRDTDAVAIEPLDSLRYGLRLHLDRASGLPLKSDLIDFSGEPIEQLMFATLAVAEPPAGAAPVPDPAPGQAQSAPPLPPVGWRFDRRPLGFEPALYDTLLDPQGAEVEHFVFSDRVSSYSVYIESGEGLGLEGVTRTGAVHAAGRRLEGYRLTAVGEVPAATLEAAVAGVRRVPGPGGGER
jgi:sigma-E factor negative regulatory protein RseB